MVEAAPENKCQPQGLVRAPGSALRGGPPSDSLAGLDAGTLRRLVTRLDSIPLFAHAYAHHLNLRFGTMSPFDVLAFAARHRLAGVKIHVEDGECRSLLHMPPAERREMGAAAAASALRLHVETSSTARADLEVATAIAADIGAESIRCYPRYEGRVSEIMHRTIADLRLLPELDPQSRFFYTLEQHEDLKSHELVSIVRAVANPRLSLLFDFGNMTNAHETPGAALAAMAPWVTEVHVKDVRILADRGGWAHRACRSGEGDIDFQPLLRELLLLGDVAPQVTAFGLEEENGMYAPAYRFPDEPADPLIPARGPSETELSPGDDLETRLDQERREAARQVEYVRGVVAGLRAQALSALAGLEARNNSQPDFCPKEPQTP